MASGDSRGVMKRCRDCKRRMKGTAGRMQWCEDCGGEMVTIGYGRKKAKRGR